MPTFSGIDHIALTVTDLHVSLEFYERVLGVEADGAMSDGPFSRSVLPLPDGTHLGLTQHDSGSGEPFNPRTPGLDHVGFACPLRSELARWSEHLDSMGVEHSGIQDAEYGSALSFKDPDGNALEFFASL
ncbi:MAG: VOC family protein [Propionibacteriaceae bacterium]|nr:VOC family protein [Propionibacteriaceae bacterium]